MKIILTQDVANLGEVGEVKEVSPGYARNFLIPNGLAVLATEGELKKWGEKLAKIKKEKQKEEESSKKEASEIQSLKVTITTKAGEGGKLFGAITNKDISEELVKLGHNVAKKDIKMDPIKHIGEYKAKAHIDKGVEAELHIEVKAE